MGFLACPLQHLQVQTLQCCRTIAELMADTTIGCFSLATDTVFESARRVVFACCRKDGLDLGTLPPGTLETMCQVPRALLQVMAMHAALPVRMAELGPPNIEELTGSRRAMERLQLTQAQEVANYIRMLYEAGPAWQDALVQQDTAECLLACLNAAVQGLTVPDVQLRAAATFGHVCSICASIVQRHSQADPAQAPAVPLLIRLWQSKTHNALAWLRAHVPHSLAQRCCSALAKVFYSKLRMSVFGCTLTTTAIHACACFHLYFESSLPCTHAPPIRHRCWRRCMLRWQQQELAAVQRTSRHWRMLPCRRCWCAT